MKKSALILGVFFIFCACRAFADGIPYDDPTLIGTGARPIGMGRAFVAIADDSNAIFFNPAGLADQKSWMISSMNTNFMDTYQYTMLSSVYPTKNGVWGVGFVSSMVGDINVTTNGGGKATFSNRALVVSYATYIGDYMKQYLGREENISGGVNFKYYAKEFSGDTTAQGSGINFDLGLKYQPREWISYGLNCQNVFLGSKITGDIEPEDMPFIAKAGVAFYWLEHDVIFDLDKDMLFGRSIPWPFHFGAEWHIHKNLYLRGGFDQVADAATGNVSTNNTFGVGIVYNGLNVNLSYMQNYSELNIASNMISISFTGEPLPELSSKPKEQEVKQAEQPVPAPVQAAKPVEQPVPQPAAVPTSAAVTKVASTKPVVAKVSINPPSGVTTMDQTINFSGMADTDVAEVEVDGARTEIKADRTFSQSVQLAPGKNVKFVHVVDVNGQTADISRNIFRFYLPGDMTIDEGSQKDVKYKVIYTEIYGYLGKNYNISKKISRELLALIIAKAKKMTIASVNAPLSKDVEPGYWSAPFIKAVLEAKIMSVYSTGDFKPDKVVTRAELAHIMTKATGYEVKFPAWKALNEEATMSDLIDAIYDSGLMSGAISEYDTFLHNG